MYSRKGGRTSRGMKYAGKDAEKRKRNIGFLFAFEAVEEGESVCAYICVFRCVIKCNHV